MKANAENRSREFEQAVTDYKAYCLRGGTIPTDEEVFSKAVNGKGFAYAKRRSLRIIRSLLRKPIQR